jgi:hypothetical protein
MKAHSLALLAIPALAGAFVPHSQVSFEISGGCSKVKNKKHKLPVNVHACNTISSSSFLTVLFFCFLLEIK